MTYHLRKLQKVLKRLQQSRQQLVAFLKDRHIEAKINSYLYMPDELLRRWKNETSVLYFNDIVINEAAEKLRMLTSHRIYQISKSNFIWLE